MARPSDNDLHDPRLGCTPYEVHYDFKERHGTLIMGERNCTDMGACIRLFRAIDPKVEFIQTYADEEIDTGYLRHEDDTWSALPHTHPGQMTPAQHIAE
jgi:hypothetical protein